MKRDVYRGIDPLINDLVHTVFSQREQIKQLKLALDSHIPKEEKKEDVSEWNGSRFLREFREQFKLSKGYDFPDGAYDDVYAARQIIQFINRQEVTKNDYYDYLLFLINNPNLKVMTFSWLWNKRYFYSFHRQRSLQVVKTHRQTKKLDLSPQLSQLAEARGLSDD